MYLILMLISSFYSFFFFNDTATTEIYTLSLHDALPIFRTEHGIEEAVQHHHFPGVLLFERSEERDRKSTRLNSSHGYISYAVFCLKKKKKLTCRSHYSITLLDTCSTRSTLPHVATLSCV